MNKILIIILTFSLLSCKNEKKKDTITKQDIKVQTDNLTSKLDSIKTELENYKTRFKTLEYLSSGEFKYTENEESDVYGENYRVEIYLSEIYKSVYISHIEYYGEGMQRISLRTKLDFEKMTGITSEQTNGLEFKKWNNFKHFEIKLGEQIYGIEIIKPNEFIISEY
ncbi:MAG: hypothetical protein CMC05_13620 [Flavobacteriaceae bacterium]|nr:hypothetical protein [Flavobacteriaceae bacterium]|tara:strand:+ start:64 stop:564 length:501 start_codon:yes stop_codon:yes gene_type:complete